MIYLSILSLLFLASTCQYVVSNLARNLAIPSAVSTTPSLILISGCTGTGKSTFGMSLALNQRILKCISTDTVRQVMRTFKDQEEYPELHRSSYQGDSDAVGNWIESSEVITDGVKSLVVDSMNRGVSLVLEGVHIIPGNDLLNMWRENGGNALGIVLCITNAEAHKKLIVKRGGNTAAALEGSAADRQVEKFERIRQIHDEMVRLGEENRWLKIETKLQRDPIEVVADVLNSCPI